MVAKRYSTRPEQTSSSGAPRCCHRMALPIAARTAAQRGWLLLNSGSRMGGSRRICGVAQRQQPASEGLRSSGSGRRPLSTTSSSSGGEAATAQRQQQQEALAGMGTMKQHYYRNERALSRIGISFIFFYITGQIYVMKNKRDAMEEQLQQSNARFESLQEALREEGWTNATAQRLGVNAERFSMEIDKLLNKQAGKLRTEDMSRSDDAEEDVKGGNKSSTTAMPAAAAAGGKKAIF